MGPASEPLQHPRRPANRPGMNRMPVQEAPEVIRQFAHRSVTVPWLLLEAFQANGLQIARQPRAKPARTTRLDSDHLPQSLEVAVRLIRDRARKQLVKNHSQGMDICGWADCLGLPLSLFRGHILRRPEYGPRPGERLPGSL